MLDGLKKIIDDLGSFDPQKEYETIIEDNAEIIVDLNRDQMMEGRGVDGEFLRPYYSENPYFKTPESAARYARWKQKITPNPQRPLDVPNLFINGYLHGSLYGKVTGKDTLYTQFEVESDVPFAESAFRVHKNALGLNAEKRLLFAEEILLPEFLNQLKEKTGLQ